MTLKIKYIKKLPEKVEKEAIEKLAKHFNELAKEVKIKYRIGWDSAYPKLVHMLWFFENYSIQIDYSGEYFKFCTDIDEEILNEIAPILNEIPEDFRVVLKK